MNIEEALSLLRDMRKAWREELAEHIEDGSPDDFIEMYRNQAEMADAILKEIKRLRNALIEPPELRGQGQSGRLFD